MGRTQALELGPINKKGVGDAYFSTEDRRQNHRDPERYQVANRGDDEGAQHWRNHHGSEGFFDQAHQGHRHLRVRNPDPQVGDHQGPGSQVQELLPRTQEQEVKYSFYNGHCRMCNREVKKGPDTSRMLWFVEIKGLDITCIPCYQARTANRKKAAQNRASQRGKNNE